MCRMHIKNIYTHKPDSANCVSLVAGLGGSGDRERKGEGVGGISTTRARNGVARFPDPLWEVSRGT